MNKDEQRKKESHIPSYIQEKTSVRVVSITNIFCAIIFGLLITGILLALQPKGGQYTVIKSIRMNATIIYDHVLTKNELPEYDPLYFENSKIKEYDYEIELRDDGTWTSKIYRVSPLHILGLICSPFIAFMVMGFLNLTINDDQVVICKDATGVIKITKKSEIITEGEIVRIKAYAGKKMSMINRWRVGAYKHDVIIYEYQIAVRTTDEIVVKGYWEGNHVRTSLRNENNRIKILVRELKNKEAILQKQDTQLEKLYDILETIMERIDPLIDRASGFKEHIKRHKDEGIEDKIKHAINEKMLYSLFKKRGTKGA